MFCNDRVESQSQQKQLTKKHYCEGRREGQQRRFEKEVRYQVTSSTFGCWLGMGHKFVGKQVVDRMYGFEDE